MVLLRDALDGVETHDYDAQNDCDDERDIEDSSCASIGLEDNLVKVFAPSLRARGRNLVSHGTDVRGVCW